LAEVISVSVPLSEVVPATLLWLPQKNVLAVSVLVDVSVYVPAVPSGVTGLIPGTAWRDRNWCQFIFRGKMN
jgi:hypothetical protein